MNRLQHLFREHGLFLIVLAIGLVFRLLFMTHQGLSNDELSGWIRTQHTTWNEFWYYGVKYGDMHPVFYQAFLWGWVRIFGDSEWSLRATGLLFYFANATLIYQISCRFFTKHTGVLINVLYAGLAFLIINTVFARPYNSGTFFVLLSFWSILEINRSKTRFSWWAVWLVVGLLGAMTSHYFAFITAGMMGISSLLFVKRQKVGTIVLCGLIACLLFLPHLSVTWFHFTRGGLGWLGQPEWNWLLHFAYQFSNYSWWIFAAIFVLATIVWFKARVIPTNRYLLFALLTFIGSYIVAHGLSLLFTPILKDLLMLFILPFLLFFLFNNAQFDSLKAKVLLIVFTIGLGIHSIYRAQLLEPANYAVFKEIGTTIDRYTRTYGHDHIEYALNANNVGYINYYSETDQPETIKNWDATATLKRLADRAKTSDKSYFNYNWTNSYHVPMYCEVIRQYFPLVEEEHLYFNSATYLFKRGDARKRPKAAFPYVVSSTFPKKDTATTAEFIGELRLSVYELRHFPVTREGYVLVESEGMLYTDAPLIFTAVLERDGGPVMNGKDLLHYFSYDQQELFSPQEPHTFFLAFPIDPSWRDTDLVKIYFWNPEKQAVRVAEPKVYAINPQDEYRLKLLQHDSADRKVTMVRQR